MHEVKILTLAHLETIHNFHNSCHNISTLKLDSGLDEEEASVKTASVTLSPSLAVFASSTTPKTIDHCIMENCVRLCNQSMELCDLIVEKAKVRHNLILDYSRNVRLLQQLEEKIGAHPNNNASEEDLLRRKEKLATSTTAVISSTSEIDSIMTNYLEMKETILHHIDSGIIAAHKMMGQILLGSLNDMVDANLSDRLTKEGLLQFDDLENETGVLRHFEEQCNGLKDLILKVLEDGFKPVSSTTGGGHSASISSVSTFATSDSQYTTTAGFSAGEGGGKTFGGGGSSVSSFAYNGTNSTFGRPLSSFPSIPLFFKACVSFLDKNGLDSVGLFRVAGDNTEVNLIKSALNSFNHDVDTPSDLDLEETTLTKIMILNDKIRSNNHIINVPNIASLLKLWFRELPVSLIPEATYKEVISLSFSPETFWEKFAGSVLPKFPEPNQRNYLVLMAFLSKISTKSDANKMTPENLAIVFAPTILKPADDVDPMSAMKNVQPAIAAVKLMIIHFREIFSPAHVDWAFGILNIDDPSKINRENRLLYGREAEKEREKRATLEAEGFSKIVKPKPKKPMTSPPVQPQNDAGGAGNNDLVDLGIDSGSGLGSGSGSPAGFKPPLISQSSSTIGTK